MQFKVTNVALLWLYIVLVVTAELAHSKDNNGYQGYGSDDGPVGHLWQLPRLRAHERRHGSLIPTEADASLDALNGNPRKPYAGDRQSVSIWNDPMPHPPPPQITTSLSRGLKPHRLQGKLMDGTASTDAVTTSTGKGFKINSHYKPLRQHSSHRGAGLGGRLMRNRMMAKSSGHDYDFPDFYDGHMAHGKDYDFESLLNIGKVELTDAEPITQVSSIEAGESHRRVKRNIKSKSKSTHKQQGTDEAASVGTLKQRRFQRNRLGRMKKQFANWRKKAHIPARRRKAFKKQRHNGAKIAGQGAVGHILVGLFRFSNDGKKAGALKKVRVLEVHNKTEASKAQDQRMDSSPSIDSADSTSAKPLNYMFSGQTEKILHRVKRDLQTPLKTCQKQQRTGGAASVGTFNEHRFQRNRPVLKERYSKWIQNAHNHARQRRALKEHELGDSELLVNPHGTLGKKRYRRNPPMLRREFEAPPSQVESKPHGEPQLHTIQADEKPFETINGKNSPGTNTN